MADTPPKNHQPTSKYKEKFNALKEVYTRVSAANANYEKDLQSAAFIRSRLQNEIDLLLEALIEVRIQEEANRQPDRQAYEQPVNGSSFSHPPPPPPSSAPPMQQ